MKTTTTLFLIYVLMSVSASAQIISQYVETDSGTSPKGIEIWNNTSSTLDFSVENLVIEKGTNGATPSPDYTLNTGTLAPDEVLIIGTTDLQDVATLNNVDFYDYGFTFNGDDALVVKLGATITDVFGMPNEDPGSSWEANGVDSRNQNIALLSGITTGELVGFTDPSTRFETISTTPSDVDNGGIDGFGVAPGIALNPNFVLQLLHYSDIDGNEESALDAVDEFSALVNFFQNEPTYSSNTLTVTSGDLIIPGPRFYAAENTAVRSLSGSNEPGHLDIAFANAFGVDVASFGNHEFDQGPGELFDAAFSSESFNDVTFPGSEFPWLASNIDFSADGDFSGVIGTDGDNISNLNSQVAKYAVTIVNGETIGIVGAVASSFPDITSIGSLLISPAPGSSVAQIATEIQPSVDALEAAGVNKIILLAHMQSISIEKELASLLDGVDIIVAGGSNTRMGDSNDVLFSNSLVTDTEFDETYPFQSSDASGDPVLVVNVDGDYKYLGRLVVEFDANGVIDLTSLDDTVNGAYAANVDLINSLSATPIQEVVDLRDAVQGVISAQYNNVVGFSSVYLDGRRSQVRTQETNLGNLTADANLWYANLLNPASDESVDISLKNGGGLRTEIGSAVIPGGSNDPDDIIFSPPANNGVSEGHLRATLRFDNGLVRLTLTASELISIIEHGLAEVAPGAQPGRFPQVGGMNFVYDPSLPAGSRLIDLVVDKGDADPSNDIVVVEDGVNVSPDGITFNMVTLNFLANGGDSYPFDQLSNPNRINYYSGVGFGETEDFPDGDLDNDPNFNSSFSYTGGEQDAMAEYMSTFHPDNDSAYDIEETPADEDTRIVIGGAVAQVNLQITEMFPGQEGEDLTEDWFEIINTGNTAWVSGVDPDLFYDDESADADAADQIFGISDIQPGERVIVLIGDMSSVMPFMNVWNPVVDLTGVEVGYTDGSGLGAGGDGVTLWIGDPLNAGTQVDFQTYPDTANNDGQSYDVELTMFSTVGNASNAVQTIALGGDAFDTPNIASPGNVPPVLEIQVSEIFPGQDGTDLTNDWFEILNSGTATWTPTDGDLYYDDVSAEPNDAVLIQGLTALAPGQRAIVVVDGDQADATVFENIWSPVIDLSNVEVGFTGSAAGLGGGGDSVFIWLGDPLGSGSIVASASYPDTAGFDGQSYDVELSAFSVVGNASSAVETIALGGDGGDTPNIGSPGNTPLLLPNVEFEETVYSVDESVGNVNVEISINEAPSNNVTVDVALVAGGSAVEGLAFTYATTQTVTFPAGSDANQILSIPILDNVNDDSDVFFVLTLENESGANIDEVDLTSVYILDDDTVVPAGDATTVDANFLSSYLVDADGTAEIGAHDPVNELLFVTNGDAVEVLDFSDVNNISNINTLQESGLGGVQSVAVNGNLVAVAYSAETKTDQGSVVFYELPELTNSVAVTVGALPDMLTFTPDGLKVLVANEGEPNDEYTIDPEGSVSVIDVSGGFANINQSSVTTLDFNAFDGDLSNLIAEGVRIFGPNASVSQDLEPEYIAVSEDSQTAYVVLQENNAYASIDLVNNTITSITAFDLKDHSLPQNSLDTSDETDFIFNSSWPILGMLMPDGVDSFNIGGVNYLITANEGDARDYSGYAEERKLDDADYVLDPAVFSNADILALETNLGDINVTVASGDANGDGLFEEIHVYGGRSFSIYEADTGNFVYDSGNDFEVITAFDPIFGAIFNASNSNNSFKNRSDNKGPEPEAVIVEEFNGNYYAFILLERIGGVMIYDVTNPNAPVFLQYLNSRGAVEGAEESGDLGPEGVILIRADESPNGLPLLVITNEVSATLSIYTLDNPALSTTDFGNVENDLSFKIYPNPVESILNTDSVGSYVVYNLNGQKVLSVENTSEINVESLSRGIYIIQNTNGNSLKFVKL
jgi:2',3'-cyclic-nucleotide 2'-phosphodiesterase (5'-nucleotidase family)